MKSSLGFIHKLLKGSAKAALHARFHHRQAAEAREALQTWEWQHGKTNPRHIKLGEAYAREVLGHARYAPWLHVYSAVAGVFKEGWIPENYYGSVVVPAVKGYYGQVSHLKSLTNSIFKSGAIPDIGYYVNGMFYDACYAAIPAANVKRALFRNTARIAFKLDNSRKGRGVYIFDESTFDLDFVRKLGNGVFQYYVVQHDLFHAFAPNAVATLRLNTAVDDAGVATVRAAFLRFGTGEDDHLRSERQICVPIDRASGRFAREGFQGWRTVERHPDTGRQFEGNSIPNFAACVALVEALHQKLPFARLVGWDVTVDEDENVCLLEWNASQNGIRLSEATQGPCFTDLGWEKLAQRVSFEALAAKPLFTTVNI